MGKNHLKSVYIRIRKNINSIYLYFLSLCVNDDALSLYSLLEGEIIEIKLGKKDKSIIF